MFLQNFCISLNITVYKHVTIKIYLKSDGWFRDLNDYTVRGMVISSTYEEKNPLMTKKTEEPKIVLLKRLSRIEGQVRGIMKMLEEDRDCVSIITQIAAVRSGIEGTGAIVLNNCMKICVNEGPNEIINLDNLSKAISIWGRVRSNDGV